MSGTKIITNYNIERGGAHEKTSCIRDTAGSPSYGDGDSIQGEASGTIGEEYADLYGQGRITVTDGE